MVHLLIGDGHLTHFDVNKEEYCFNNDIHILQLPAHTNDVLQPIGKSLLQDTKIKVGCEVFRMVQKYLTEQREAVHRQDNILLQLCQATFRLPF